MSNDDALLSLLLLLLGQHHSPRLQNAWTKHGPDAFEVHAPAELPAGELRLAVAWLVAFCIIPQI